MILDASIFILNYYNIIEFQMSFDFQFKSTNLYFGLIIYKNK